jgi:hypothetical protein
MRPSRSTPTRWMLPLRGENRGSLDNQDRGLLDNQLLLVDEKKAGK